MRQWRKSFLEGDSVLYGRMKRRMRTGSDSFRHLSTASAIISDVGNEIRPKEIQKLLEKVEGKPEEDLISRLTLRSMKQARYTTENTGHFGLAAKYYTHFTSPIRRYPDLQIHRIIKENLRGRFDENRAEHYSELLQQVAAQCSERREEPKKPSGKL
mgnify:CR=1 FL=1